MKKIDYFWSSAVVKITGIVFLSQLLLEVGGLIIRKPEYWWVTPACLAAFLASCIYVFAVAMINAWRTARPEGEKR